MRKSFLLLFALLTSTLLFAQNKKSTSSAGQSQFYAEGGGPGVMFSANYDRRFKTSRLGWGARAGLGFVTVDRGYYSTGSGWTYEPRSVVSVPLQINYVFGKENSPHTFEAGAGITFFDKEIDIFNFNDNTSYRTLGSASFMYRRAPLDGGFTWRIGFSPLFGKSFVQPFGAVGVGYSF